jgi:hypothetical protein
MVHLGNARLHNIKKVKQFLLQQKPAEFLPKLTVLIYL